MNDRFQKLQSIFKLTIDILGVFVDLYLKDDRGSFCQFIKVKDESTFSMIKVSLKICSVISISDQNANS